MEDIVIVDSKDYAQVIFEDVESSYAENQPIECAFTINELLKPEESDTVGIFKIGFQVYKDYVCLQNVQINSIQEGKGKVTFPADDLPKDDGEFYQFIYLSQAKQIRGASIPFQIKRPHMSDYVEVEEPEAVIIKTKESAINETINEIKNRCVHLTEANDMYEKLIKENEDLIYTLKEEVSSVKLRCLHLTMDNEKLNQTLKSKADNLKNLADTIANLTDENNRLQHKFESLAHENKNLVDSLQHRIEQVAQLKNDLETVKLSKDQLEAILNLKECELLQLKQDKDELNRIADDLQRINEQIGKLEKQVNDRVEELTKIKTDLKKNETIVSEQTETIQAILNEKDNLNNHIEKLTKEKNELEYNQENLNQELTMSKDKLMAAEQCKEMLRNQLLVTTTELNDANARIDEYLATIKQMINKEKQFETEKAELKQKMQQMQNDYENKLEQVNGSYYALKLAHIHLESRIKANDNVYEKYLNEIQEQKFTILRLRTENDELKERIAAGANEYKKLFERFRNARRGQLNQDLNELANEFMPICRINNNNGEKATPTSSAAAAAASSNNSSSVHYRQPFRSSSVAANIDQSDLLLESSSSGNLMHATNSADIENTLLDALLNSSLQTNHHHFHQQQHNWNLSQQLQLQLQQQQQQQEQTTLTSAGNLTDLQQQFAKLATTSTPIVLPPPTATTQPKGAASATASAMLTSSTATVEDDDEEELPINLKSQQRQPSYRTIMTLKAQMDSINSSSGISSEITGAAAAADNFETRYNMNKSEPKMCDICNYSFPTGTTLIDFETHYSIHYGPSCPVCFLTFHKGYPQDEFEKHVNSHFSN